MKNPACPSIDFSIKALQGQTVTQWPQETQLDSADSRATVPQHPRVWVFPIDRKRFIHLEVLAGFDAAATKDALIRIVTIKGIRIVDFVWLECETGYF